METENTHTVSNWWFAAYRQSPGTHTQNKETSLQSVSVGACRGWMEHQDSPGFSATQHYGNDPSGVK